MGVGGTRAWLDAHDEPIRDADRHFVAQAALLVEAAAVHRPAWQAAGVDPVAALRQLQRQEPPATRAALFGALLAIFARAGDRHTRCVLPAPWADAFAYLPFTVAACTDRGRHGLIVTRSATPALARGDRLVGWNGGPVAAAIAANAALQLGANPAARHAKAVQTLTVRPLALLPPPTRPVDVRLETAVGERTLRLDWQVGDATALGRAFGASRDEAAAVRRLETAAGSVAWVSPRSLRLPADRLVAPIAAQIDRDAPDALVLDLRGCEEGFVPTGEHLLRLFGDAPPFRFEMRATHRMRDLVCAAPALAEWRPAMAAVVPGDDTFCAVRPLAPSPPSATPNRFRGRLVVVVDALTYSTAEMVAAAVQDHRLGTVVGVAPRTGGGGAIAWSQAQVHALSGDAFLAPGEGAPGLRVAVMRCRRTGAGDNRLIEGSGVQPDVLHVPTARDVLENDADLVANVVDRLRER